MYFGNALVGQAKLDEAAVEYRKALHVKPDYAEVHMNLGNVLARQAKVDEAIAEYRKALDIKPDRAEAHNNLGSALAGQGKLDEAMAEFRKALELRPDYADARGNLGSALYAQGRIPEAIAQWREVLRSQPKSTLALTEIARVLATSPEKSLRNGAEAVELAQRAAKLTGGRDPTVLDTLAAAYAEAGRFSDALPTAEQALALASSQKNTALADALRARIKLYQAGSPYHEAPQPSTPHSGPP
jgi:tetratricopeptide (TPR) repeat protein